MNKADFIIYNMIKETEEDCFCTRCLAGNDKTDHKISCSVCGNDLFCDKDTALYRARIQDVKEYLGKIKCKVLRVVDSYAYTMVCKTEDGEKIDIFIDKEDNETLDELIEEINSLLGGN